MWTSALSTLAGADLLFQNLPSLKHSNLTIYGAGTPHTRRHCHQNAGTEAKSGGPIKTSSMKPALP